MLGKTLITLTLIALTGCVPDSGSNRDYDNYEFARTYNLRSNIPDNGPVVEAVEKSIANVYGSPENLLEETFSRKFDDSFASRFGENLLSEFLGDLEELEFSDVPNRIGKEISNITFSSTLEIEERQFDPDEEDRYNNPYNSRYDPYNSNYNNNYNSRYNEREFVGRHQVTRLSFRVDGRTHSYNLNESDGEGSSAVVPLFYTNRRLRIEDHELEMPLASAIASKLADTKFFQRGGPVVAMMNDLLNCSEWADAVEKRNGEAFRIPFLSFCRAVAEESALEMQKLLAETEDDEYSYLSIKGSAEVVERNDDNRVDALTDGTWSGIYIHDIQDEESQLRDIRFDGTRGSGY